jgi:hypothetical protein
MTRRCLTVTALIGAVLLLPKCDVEACGAFFEPDIFVNGSTPDDHVAFASGQLGIIQAGFDSSDYAVAYRYLNGGKLGYEERIGYTPFAATDANKQTAGAGADATDIWLTERTKYVPMGQNLPQPPTFRSDGMGNIVLDSGYLNCPGAAFRTATLTLTNRAQQWGKESKWLADWIHAQDAVFSNCMGTALIPAPAPEGSPALLKADRAYQTAAAAFYASKFDEAAQQFAAIAADHNSPWSDWGAYLAARALVRKAFETGKTTDPYSGDLASFDSATMRQAQQMLESLVAQPNPTPSRQIIQSELNFVLMRTDPQRRAAELATALAGPAPDSNFAQDLKDLSFLLMKNIDVKGPAPLLDWIKAWRGGVKAADAYSTWQQTRVLPWLVIAMDKAGPKDPFGPELIEDAKKIAPRTVAYDTVFYHRVRLLIGMSRTDEARTLLDATIPAMRKQKASSELNSLLGERMQVARTFAEFLEFAPRTILYADSQGKWDMKGQCNQGAHAVNAEAPCPGAERPIEFDEDSAQILNRKTPLALLVEAARTTTLPQNLRENIAVMAWTRSVLLQDAQSAASVAPILPKAIREAAGTGVGFSADLAILRNPGIRPYLEAGIPRVASFSYFDDFRNNWWCKPWNEQQGYGEQNKRPIPDPSFLPADQIALGDMQYAQLQKLPSSGAVIGQRVLDYAKAHPDDPQVPGALALTVRATHYACQTYDYTSGGSPKSEYTPTGKAAFEFLHRRYPKSPWTAKTPYYY